MPRKRIIPALIGAPYRAPALRVGDVTTCLYLDGDVRVTGWTDAASPWPLCRRVGRPGGAPSLLVDEELLRAIRTESGLALQHWWGVSKANVTRWRRAFGVEHWGTEGSRLLHAASSEKGAEALRGRTPSEEELVHRVATRRARAGYVMPERWAETGWKPEEIALLGTMPDKELAERIGRSRSAVRACRVRLGIPARPSQTDGKAPIEVTSPQRSSNPEKS